MRNRNKIVTISSGYTKIPSKLFKMNLSPSAFMIFTALCFYSEDFNPTLTNLARLTGISRNTVCRSLKELCDAGVIRKIKQGHVMRTSGTQFASDGSSQSEYEFISPSDWSVPKIVTVTNPLTENLTDTPETIE